MLSFKHLLGKAKNSAQRAAEAVRPAVRYQLAYRTVPLALLWVLLVLYPNPFNIAISVHRVFSPDIDPLAVESLLVGLPAEPEAIEREVLRRIPYRYDWEVHGMPWFFPRTARVIAQGEGDCKARAVVLASVFERLEIPYRFNSSFVHVWVEYDGKAETVFENPGARFYQQDPETGERFLQVPEVAWRLWFDSTKVGLWDVMPAFRKVLLLAGVTLLVITGIVLRRNTNNGIDNAKAL